MQFKVNYELFQVKSDGKETKVEIMNTDTGEIFEGVSHKNEADGFNMQVGYNIALRRAILNMIKDYIEFDNDTDGDGIDNPLESEYLTEIK